MNWPGFSAITNAWWLLLLVPLLIFYFLKLKRPRVEISSLALWQSVLNDQRVNSPFQRFRRNILLWLQMAALMLLVAASMQPFIPGTARPAAYQPVLIDCSASMAARDPVSGKTRLEEARERVVALIENLKPDQQLALIAVHSSADRLTEFTGNRRVLLDAVQLLQVRDVASEMDDALRMTQAMARTVPVESAILISDGNIPRKVRFALPFDLNYQQLAVGGPNAGITAFNARLATEQSWHVFLRVEASADTYGRLILQQDGQPIGEQPFVLGPGESQRLTFQVHSDRATKLEARLEFGSRQFDSLDSDNIAWLDLPVARPLRVYSTPSLESFRRALAAMSGVDLYPADDQPEQRSVVYDLVISDQVRDAGLTASVHLLIGVIPDQLASLVEPVRRSARFLDWDRTAPLLRHAQLADIETADAIRLMDDADVGDVEAAGFSILASGTAGPMVLRQKTASTLNYYTLFHTSRSTLEFRVAFPVLVANLVQVARQEASMGNVSAVSTGVLPPLRMNAGSVYSVIGPDSSRQQVRVSESGILQGVTASQAGRYELISDTVESVSVAANLLSTEESTLKAVDRIDFDEQSIVRANETLQNDRPVWSLLALLALCVTLVEWWFFQRPVHRVRS